MKRILGLATCLCKLLAISATPSRAELIQNERTPVSFTMFDPCANSGAGEDILFTGDEYRLHFVGHPDPFKISRQNGQSEFSSLSTLVIVGPGPGNNLLAHGVSHLTVNANGEVTATFTRRTSECR